jgi:hypothetical protein
VDAGALDSVVRQAPQPPLRDKKYVGYVNLVDGLWGANLANEREEEEEEEEEVGLDEEEEDWMRVAVKNLIPDAYEALYDRQMYYLGFGKPPHVWKGY